MAFRPAFFNILGGVGWQAQSTHRQPVATCQRQRQAETFLYLSLPRDTETPPLIGVSQCLLVVLASNIRAALAPLRNPQAAIPVGAAAASPWLSGSDSRRGPSNHG